MLSSIIKGKIEERFGNKVRYPKDCDALAADISKACKERISASTLKRLYGFVKEAREPRLFTLDIIASYLGFISWEKLITSIGTKTDTNNHHHITKLELSDIKDKCYRIEWYPEKFIEIAGSKLNGFVCVLNTNDKDLRVQDLIQLDSCEIEHPLIILAIVRDGKLTKGIQLATLSGVLTITVVDFTTD